MAVVDTAGYFSTATWVPNARNGGGTYDPESWGYPFRIVLHTIEGSASPGMIAGHQYPPQLWYRPSTRQLFQTIPISRSGFALYQASDAPHYTNKARAIQVELEGRAAEAGEWPQEWLDNITYDLIIPICQWVASHGASIDLSQAPAPGPIPNSARSDAPQRMTATGWAIFNGLCSHRHVPMGDDHWDTGGLDTPRIAQHAAMVIGGLITDTPGRPSAVDDEEEDMPIIVQLNEPADPQNGSLWITDGLFKRRINTIEEYDRLIAQGAAKKQPADAAGNRAGWASWNIGQLAPLATIDEWSLAGLAGLPAQIAALPAAKPVDVQQIAGPVAAQVGSAVAQALASQQQGVAAAVAQTIEHQLSDLPQRLAVAIKSAFSNPLPPLREPAPPAPPTPN